MNCFGYLQELQVLSCGIPCAVSPRQSSRVLHLSPNAIKSLLEIQPESKMILNTGEAGSQLRLEEFRK